MTLASSPLRAALDYARQGRPVFPVWPPAGAACSCPEGEACGRPGKHPLGSLVPHGHLDATTDEARLMKWLTARPDANLAERTGPEFGRFVVDVDPRHGGDVTLEELETQHGKLPYSLRARTGSGGQHIVFAYPNHGRRILSRTNALGPGLDVKGEGGYIVVAPSRHVSGGTYAWQDEEESHLEEAPEWLLELLCERQEGTGTEDLPDEVDAPAAIVARAKAYLAKIPGGISGQGGHDQTFMAAVVLVRGFGLSVRQALALLEADFNPRCKPPWTAKELRHKVEDARKNGRLPFRYLLEKDPAAETPPPPAGAPVLFFTAADELRQRRPLGPAVATGLPTLDGILEGGLRSGTHVVLVGPPESGKTTFGAHCVARWIDAAAKHAALIYARDEAPGAFVNRLAQHLGFDRAALRRNDPETCERAAVALDEWAGTRLQFLDPFKANLNELLEKAEQMRAAGLELVDLVDSLQVAQTIAGAKAPSMKDRIDAAMAIGTELAARGDLVLSLSQSSRAGYAEPKNGRDPRAEGSGSAGIEFNADVLLGFTSKADDDPTAPRTVTVRKGRGGLAKGTVSFVVDRETTVIHEVDRDAAQEAECYAAEAKLRPYQDALLAELRKAAAAGEKRSGRYLEQNVPGGTPAIRKALKALVVAKAVFMEDGPRGALLYYAPTSPHLARPRPHLAPGAVVDDGDRDLATSPPPLGGARSAGRGRLTRGDVSKPDSDRGAPGRGQEVAG